MDELLRYYNDAKDIYEFPNGVIVSKEAFLSKEYCKYWTFEISELTAIPCGMSDCRYCTKEETNMSQLKRGRFSKVEVDRAKELVATGKTVEEVATELNRGVESVTKALDLKVVEVVA